MLNAVVELESLNQYLQLKDIRSLQRKRVAIAAGLGAGAAIGVGVGVAVHKGNKSLDAYNKESKSRTSKALSEADMKEMKDYSASIKARKEYAAKLQEAHIEELKKKVGNVLQEPKNAEMN